MKDVLLEVMSKADALKLSAALFNLVDAVKGCDEKELQELHRAGRLPMLCLEYVLSRRTLG